MRKFYEIRIVVAEDPDHPDSGFEPGWIETFAQESLEDPYDLDIVEASIVELKSHPALLKLEEIIEGYSPEAQNALRGLFKEVTKC
jgi:hypothetical protein